MVLEVPKIPSIGIYLKIILKAPKGVTRIAGAYAYAAKLATSPTITTQNEIN